MSSSCAALSQNQIVSSSAVTESVRAHVPSSPVMPMARIATAAAMAITSRRRHAESVDFLLGSRRSLASRWAT